MSLPSFSLKRPVFAIVLSIIILLFGVIGYTFLGVREYPSVDPPQISVRTNYIGANAEIIESQITEPLEKGINGIAGIKSISSSSAQGVSNITVEFELSVDLESAANDVRDKVSQAVRTLPLDIDGPPIVNKADANSDAVISMTIQSDTKNHLQVSEFASNVLLERLQTIPGVSGIQIWGEKKYAMRLWMDPAKMSAYSITPSDVQNALIRENVELPSGKIAGYSTDITLKTEGLFKNEEEFNNMIISNTDGREIRFKDIGEAILGPENEETILKESGVPMVALALIPQPGSNYVEIADEFYKRFEQIKKDIPKDIKVNIALDSTQFVKNSILEVKETLLIAFLLVVLIIYLFFRNWSIALRPLIDIPVSLIGTFFIMYLCGFTINVLTLLGIVLATGLVVDDGIVVTENIFKKLEAGMSREKAAREGSEEIFFAVIATSITLAVVFLPIIFLEGFVGRLFREFGIVVAGAVLISAFVSLTLTPVLNLKLAGDHSNPGWFYRVTEPFYEGMDRVYKSMLTAFMKIRWVAIPVVIVCFGLIYFLFKSLPAELAPMEDRSAFRLQISSPEGTAFPRMEENIRVLENELIDSIPEKRIVLSVTAPGFTGAGAVNTGFVRVMLQDPADRTRNQQEIVDMVGRFSAMYQEGKIFTIQDQTISTGGAAKFGLPVQFVIQNNDFNKIRAALPQILVEANKSPVFQGVDANLKFNKPEINITIDREKATSLGVSIADISSTLQLAYSGRRFGYFTMNGKQYQVIGQVDRKFRDEPLDLQSLYVRSKSGKMVQLDNLIQMREVSNPPQLYHYDRYKSATISAALARGKTIGEGITEIENISKKYLDDSFTTSLSGASRDFTESSSNTMFAFLLALILIYLILAAQFESFIDPFIIMVTVPLAIAGALLALWIFGQTNNIFSQIGIIMLIGLVTKNGILIVEFANKQREKGLSKIDAVINAAGSRLRPILMTTLATMLGATPIALALGAGAQSRIPLGIVIVGGLAFSLVLTLFIVPAIYSFISSKSKPHVEHE
ncbi:MAG: efflux RND transporter permease subunit [Saprospiraceae bacterium]